MTFIRSRHGVSERCRRSRSFLFNDHYSRLVKVIHSPSRSSKSVTEITLQFNRRCICIHIVGRTAVEHSLESFNWRNRQNSCTIHCPAGFFVIGSFPVNIVSCESKLLLTGETYSQSHRIIHFADGEKGRNLSSRSRMNTFVLKFPLFKLQYFSRHAFQHCIELEFLCPCMKAGQSCRVVSCRIREPI